MAGTPILVVEDAPVSLKMIRLLLTHEGYEVRTAERAEEALQMLSTYRPELILADIQLPGMNGLDMTRKLKENPTTSAIRVVALTACAMKEDRENCLRAGCEDYISKPIDTSALSSKVRELLARPAIAAAAPPIAPPDAEPALGLSGREIDSIRRRFLNEGADRSCQLVDGLEKGFDPGLVARQLREWLGCATLLGHTEIADLSRKAEELLREEPVMVSRLRDALTDLFLTFAERRDAQAEPLPDFVIQATTGKKVALIGFSDESGDTMCSMLERVKARPRLFNSGDASAAEAILACDVVVLHVRQSTLESPWLQPGLQPPTGKLLLMGDRRDLIALAPEVRSRAMDFLGVREEPEEVLLRLAFALSRTAAAVPAPPSAAAPVLLARPRPAVARPTVVLADDDEIVIALVGPTLENYGMTCQPVGDGREALDLIRLEHPHAAVLDVNMPGMDGFEVLAAIRTEKLPCRVILLSASQKEKDILRAFDLGADDYLTKPFNPFELVARLKRLLS